MWTISLTLETKDPMEDQALLIKEESHLNISWWYFRCQWESSKSLKYLREISLHVSVERIELESDFSSINLKIKINMINTIISTKFQGGKKTCNLRQESYNSFVRSIKRIFFKHVSIQMYTTHSIIKKKLFKIMVQLSKKQKGQLVKFRVKLKSILT